MSKPTINADGKQEWYNDNGILHRDDGPAYIESDGTEQWWIHGHRHREDGPAVVWSNGTKEWWVNHKRHRVDGPARIYADGTKAWYQNGLLHRLDGPATIYSHGVQEWYRHGKRHRVDGPARINKNYRNEWYVNGKQLNNDTITLLARHLTPTDAVACYLTHPNLTPHNIKQFTGWDPTTEPTERQLNTWRMLTGLTL